MRLWRAKRERESGSVFYTLFAVSTSSVLDTRVRCVVCSGARRLSIAACWVPLVRFLMIIFFVVAWPLSKLIDKLLGDEGHTQLYRRSELKELIERHAGTAQAECSCDAWRAALSHNPSPCGTCRGGVGSA